jgi:hypothetical protein
MNGYYSNVPDEWLLQERIVRTKFVISVVIFVLFQYIGILLSNLIQKYCKLDQISMFIVLWIVM